MDFGVIFFGFRISVLLFINSYLLFCFIILCFGFFMCIKEIIIFIFRVINEMSYIRSV